MTTLSRPLLARAQFYHDPRSVAPEFTAVFHRRDLAWLRAWLELCGFVEVGWDEPPRMRCPGGEGKYPPHWRHRNRCDVEALILCYRGGRCSLQVMGITIDELLPPEVWSDTPEVQPW